MQVFGNRTQVKADRVDADAEFRGCRLVLMAFGQQLQQPHFLRRGARGGLFRAMRTDGLQTIRQQASVRNTRLLSVRYDEITAVVLLNSIITWPESSWARLKTLMRLMPIERVHSYLVHPSKHDEEQPEVSGTQIPRRGSLYAMLGDIRYITLFRSTRYLDSFLVSLV